MSILTDLTSAQIRDDRRDIEGKMLTRPRLLISDGRNLTYAADVDIGQRSPGSTAPIPLRNVPVANGDHTLIYAEVGAAVRLHRSESGRWEIAGFSKRAPGTYKRVPVTVPSFCFGIPTYDLGTLEDVGLSARALTYQELSTLGGGYGTAPYAATALFQGTILLEITG